MLKDFAERHGIPKYIGALMLFVLGFTMGRAIAALERYLTAVH